MITALFVNDDVELKLPVISEGYSWVVEAFSASEERGSSSIFLTLIASLDVNGNNESIRHQTKELIGLDENMLYDSAIELYELEFELEESFSTEEPHRDNPARPVNFTPENLLGVFKRK